MEVRGVLPHRAPLGVADVLHPVEHAVREGVDELAQAGDGRVHGLGGRDELHAPPQLELAGSQDGQDGGGPGCRRLPSDGRLLSPHLGSVPAHHAHRRVVPRALPPSGPLQRLARGAPLHQLAPGRGAAASEARAARGEVAVNRPGRLGAGDEDLDGPVRAPARSGDGSGLGCHRPRTCGVSQRLAEAGRVRRVAVQRGRRR
mmetsp:Transcript_76928/g.223390  ORF Transcript_76928/g.223390 Transcript_76928/m.223390 type:complete len:202 (+) Transcript_76928:690-1295(+)